jgi:aspartate racemase
MPRIQPQYPDVNWPTDEGIIGVVGVAPWATLDFCRKIYELTPASKDWHYPRILIDANSKIPSRGRHLKLGETDPSPFIKATIQELSVAGATIAVVPCNTAHILYSRWAENPAIPIISIIDATISAIPEKSGMTVATLGSRYLSDSGLYQNHLIEAGHTLIKLTEIQQATISYCIDQLKQQPSPSPEVIDKMSSLVKSLQLTGVETVILACTELSILNTHEIWANLTLTDSNIELARAALHAIGINF